MPTTIQTTVYAFDELSDPAKETARAWHRETGLDHAWHEFVYADFEAVCAILGVRLQTSPIRLMGGGSRPEPHIFFRGFWSQGDGACFEGTYAYERRARTRIKQHAPQDPELHRIADILQTIQRRNSYQLRAEARHRGHCHHEHSMAISVERDSPAHQDMTADAEETISNALRDLARWLYRQLEREYDYQTSDEMVDEAIRIGGYTFTEDGGRFGSSYFCDGEGKSSG
ncbi:antitoxin of toxin-antitoxin stability system [Azospirillum sp.]|uniref:antitoxin of toxin-antitoxin stability system n=1 Tax=Azospirillum sp. TaxID=34012 RepID=UPI002603C6EB|nr:antitoxin of toxin-antitoxin stability system [Azospirillum sp.]